jgi:hypothetical protein
MQKSDLKILNAFGPKCLWRVLVIGIFGCAGLLIVSYLFIGLVQMGSTSMNSTREISKGLLSIQKGDRALILKHVHHPLLHGDLVVVTYIDA